MGLDLSVFVNGETRALILHLIGEASKVHVAHIVKVGKEVKDKDRQSIVGNINAKELIAELESGWFKYFNSPEIVHCDRGV